MNIHYSCRRNVGLWQNHIESLLVGVLGVGIGFCNVDGKKGDVPGRSVLAQRSPVR